MRTQMGCGVAVALALGAGAASGTIMYSAPDLLLEYTAADIGTQKSLAIEPAGPEASPLEFVLYNDGAADPMGDFYVAGLDPTRGGGFITDFDDNDYGVFRTFAFGDSIGPDLEDGIGFETLTHAGYEYFDFGEMNTSTPHLNQTVYLAFGIFGELASSTPNDPTFGTLYGWMCVEFGALKLPTDSTDPGVFVRVKEFAVQTSGSSMFVGEVPAPGSVAMVALGGVIALRRRR